MIILPLLFFALAHATMAYPRSTTKPAENLERYLEYLFGGGVDFRCAESGGRIRCIDKDFETTEKDENNATVRTRFERLELLFDGKLLSFFERHAFEAALAEHEAAEKSMKRRKRGSKVPRKPVPTPLKDAMDRALWSHLDKMVLKKLRVDVSDPETHTSVGEIVYENGMKRREGNVSCGERIFGTISLRYRDFVAVSDDASDSAYATLTHRLETWLETNDTARADYVGKKLQRLYAERMGSPGSGSLTLTTRYLGNDNLALAVRASGSNTLGDRSRFSFDGELHRLSALFPPEGKNRGNGKNEGPGMPDFLFLSLDLESSVNNDAYRRLLKSDGRFRRYITQYDTLVGARYDETIGKYGANPVIAGWFKAAKEALSKMIRGEADRFTLSVRNKTGATAMQLVGAVVGQLAIMGKRVGDGQKEKIILDTAAQHLDIRIEAK
jgi:hypothetical protein